MEGGNVARDWHNWARTASASPTDVIAASDPRQISEVIVRAAQAGRTVRMVGSGHSFTTTAVANDIMITPGSLTGVRSVDAAAGRGRYRSDDPVRGP